MQSIFSRGNLNRFNNAITLLWQPSSLELQTHENTVLQTGHKEFKNKKEREQQVLRVVKAGSIWEDFWGIGYDQSILYAIPKEQKTRKDGAR